MNWYHHSCNLKLGLDNLCAMFTDPRTAFMCIYAALAGSLLLSYDLMT